MDAGIFPSTVEQSYFELATNLLKPGSPVEVNKTSLANCFQSSALFLHQLQMAAFISWLP